MSNVLEQSFQDSISLKSQVLKDESFQSIVLAIAGAFVEAYKNGNNTRFCGNGGSAGDAQHIEPPDRRGSREARCVQRHPRYLRVHR